MDKGQVLSEESAWDSNSISSFPSPTFPDFPSVYEEFPYEPDSLDYPDYDPLEYPTAGDIAEDQKGTEEGIIHSVKVNTKGRRPGVVEILKKKLVPRTLQLSKAGQNVRKRFRQLVGRTAERAALLGQVTGEVLGAGAVAVGQAGNALLEVSCMGH